MTYDLLRCNLPAAALKILGRAYPCIDFSRCLEQRGLDIQKPNSQNRDPIFTQYSLPEHTPGYPVQLVAIYCTTLLSAIHSAAWVVLPCRHCHSKWCTSDDRFCNWLQGGIFAPIIPGDLEELKLKELKNGRLAM
jgi:light-harvesting complex I chlorophyll a/b binding protein 4